MSGVIAAVRNLPQNPVLRRELDVRARSRVSAAAIGAWLLILAGIASLGYYGYSSSGSDPFTADNAEIGREIFHWTIFGMMGLVLFLVPAFTASAIAGERTRETLIPVQMTALGPFEIVLGKSLAAIAFTVLLLLAAAPMLAIAFLVGGVNVGDIASAIGIMVLTAVMLGAVGIFLSSVFRSVQAATVLTYGFVAVLVLGSLIVLAIVAVVQNLDNDFNSESPPPIVLAVNPFAGLADAVAEPESDIFFNGPSNPISAIRRGIFEMHRDRAENDVVIFNRGDGPDNDFEVTAVWRWYVVFSVLTTYLSMYFATNRLRTPAETER